ncbi:hypothetical protein [Lactococcus cremoris]|uniref:Uncharacterized protein n=1 Tax=Lactococcus cremoris subsp. tructae TaxID=542833 RepID=A0A2A5SPT8_LACLC|nr:hypothetical protein [Lactococcus cremoris]PCS16088.1 hypothetical protein RU92_GL001111 [Lactococcus cremoris subsp. tructae]
MENNKKRKSLKGVALGVTVATTLGATVAPATMAMAETTSNSNEIYQIDNPYKLLMNTLNSNEFKQACNEKNAKKVSDVLKNSGITVTHATNNNENGQVRMAVVPVVATEVALVLSVAAVAVAAFVVGDGSETNSVGDLKIQDSGVRFVLNDIYKETGDESFVREFYNMMALPQ